MKKTISEVIFSMNIWSLSLELSMSINRIYFFQNVDDSIDPVHLFDLFSKILKFRYVFRIDKFETIIDHFIITTGNFFSIWKYLRQVVDTNFMVDSTAKHDTIMIILSLQNLWKLVKSNFLFDYIFWHQSHTNQSKRHVISHIEIFGKKKSIKKVPISMKNIYLRELPASSNDSQW